MKYRFLDVREEVLLKCHNVKYNTTTSDITIDFVSNPQLVEFICVCRKVGDRKNCLKNNGGGTDKLELKSRQNSF